MVTSRRTIAVACATLSLCLLTPARRALEISASAQTSPRPASVATRGKDIYDRHCAECHGVTGLGDGPAAFHLIPRPRDFTLGRYKIRTTATGTLPTDDDLIQSVRQGLYGSAMPGWQTLLPDADIRAVVEYVKSFSPRFTHESPQAILPGPAPEAGPAAVARGAAVFEKLQCGKCHGSDGRGTGATAVDFEDDWGQPLRATDLTEPWTFHGGPTSADVYMRLQTGMSGTPMPSFADTASDAEFRDLASYVVSLARKPLWEMNAEETAAHFARQDAEARASPVKRGRYLVDTLGCALCHSPVDEQKRMLRGLRLAGGLRIRVEPFGDYPSGNLTSDRDTGLGAWTDEEIKRAITKGILRDGTRLLPYPMDWPSYSTLSENDLSAIVAYLRTVPPVRNAVPPPRKTFLPLLLWGKFTWLFLGGDPPMTFYAGNAGSTEVRQ